jgi:hypothetical protein
MVTMFRTLPDIAVLMILGSVPDYVQGFMKLVWLLSGKAHQTQSLNRIEVAG